MQGMSHIGLRELRQHASDVVRRAESGETITITVSGRDAAVLSPIGKAPWQRFEDIGDIFSVHTDPDWVKDAKNLDDTPRDPWSDV